MQITILPEGEKIEVHKGDNLLSVLTDNGWKIKSSCGGAGTCGQCKVRVQGQVSVKSWGKLTREQQEDGWVLACQAFVEDDLTVEAPASSRLTEHQVLLEKESQAGPKEQSLPGGYRMNPLVQKVTVTLEPPTLTENISDLTKLLMEIKNLTGYTNVRVSLPVLRKLADVLREGKWEATVILADFHGYREIIEIYPGRRELPAYGLAVDIGTTTVAVSLVDLANGETVGRAGSYNRQAAHGDDVISRMIYAAEENNGLHKLQDAVVDTINELIGSLMAKHKLSPTDFHAVVAAGNTTMTHLFLALPPTYIRLEPYTPTATEIPPFKAGPLGLKVHPEAWVMNFPAVGSYVGGDIISGTLFTDLTNQDEVTLFIDIGTNGEIVLGNRDWLVSCACSAGPAFEGGGITYGMRAMTGAVERVEIGNDYEPTVHVIGDGKPVGICGSGLIDGLAKLREAGIIDRSGQVQRVDSPRVRERDGEREYVLVWGKESGTAEDIVLNESDIKNLIRAKGAIYAGIRSLLGIVQLPVEAIERVIIAGGFGNYLNIPDAVKIGLLPDLPQEKYLFVGNSSLQGARMALLSQDACEAAREIGRKMTYIELSVGNIFMDEFVSALFLPHTDLSQFPSVKV